MLLVHELFYFSLELHRSPSQYPLHLVESDNHIQMPSISFNELVDYASSNFHLFIIVVL